MPFSVAMHRFVISASFVAACAASAAQTAYPNPRASGDAAINPMTGEPEGSEALRRRLGQLQVQARIEVELTNIERSRQERRRLATGDSAPLRPMPAPTKVARASPTAVNPVVDRPAVLRTVPPPEVEPRLLGTIQDSERSTAVIDVGGRAMTLARGQAAAGIAVESVATDSAVLNGHIARMASVPGRMAAPAGEVPSPATRFPGLSLGANLPTSGPTPPMLTVPPLLSTPTLGAGDAVLRP